MEMITMRGEVTEMSLYQNCNSVRNTTFQISDEQWFLESKKERLTCTVVGLALRGIQAVLDKCFLLPMNHPPWPSFLQPVQRAFHLQDMFGMIVFLTFYLESSIPALNPSAYLDNSETPKFSQYLF